MKDCTVVFKSTMPTSTKLYLLAYKPENGKSIVMDTTTNPSRWWEYPDIAKNLRVVATCTIIHPVFMPGKPGDVLELFRQKFYQKLGNFCWENSYGEKFVEDFAWMFGEELPTEGG